MVQNVFRQEKKLADKFLGDRVFVELFVGGGGSCLVKRKSKVFCHYCYCYYCHYFLYGKYKTIYEFWLEQRAWISLGGGKIKLGLTFVKFTLLDSWIIHVKSGLNTLRLSLFTILSSFHFSFKV